MALQSFIQINGTIQEKIPFSYEDRNHNTVNGETVLLEFQDGNYKKNIVFAFNSPISQDVGTRVNIGGYISSFKLSKGGWYTKVQGIKATTLP